MPQPTNRQVHVDTALTTIALAYKQDVTKLIADKVFPIVPVEKQSDKIIEFNKEYWMRTAARTRAPATESAGGGFEITSDKTYFCDVQAFHQDLSEQTEANSDIADLERQITEFVTWNLLLKRERDFVSNFFDDTGKTPGTNFWQDVVDLQSGSNKAWNESDSNPIEDIEVAKEAIAVRTGFWPNTLVLGPKAYRALRMNSKIQAQIAYSPAAAPGVKTLITPQLLAQLFDLERVLVGFTPQITTPEKAATQAFDFVYSDNALLVYSAPRPGILVPTGGYIFEWKGYNSGYSLAMSSFFMRELKANRIEGELAYDQKMLGPDLGYFWKKTLLVS